MSDIEKCPFCGGDAKCEKRNSGYQVRCQWCGARGSYVVEPIGVYGVAREKAIKKWNRRVTIQDEQG